MFYLLSTPHLNLIWNICLALLLNHYSIFDSFLKDLTNISLSSLAAPDSLLRGLAHPGQQGDDGGDCRIKTRH